jgi:type IV secretion system protein VirB1
MKLLFGAVIPFLVLLPASSANADRVSLDTFSALVSRCTPQAPLSTIRAIVRVESGFAPYALSINRPQKTHLRLKRQPHSKEEALYWTTWLVQHGFTVSAGLMQVNIEDATKHGFAATDLFDPCTNLKLGWHILTEKYQSPAAKFGPGQQALLEALSLYNSGSRTLGFSNGYVSSVIKGESNSRSSHRTTSTNPLTHRVRPLIETARQRATRSR